MGGHIFTARGFTNLGCLLILVLSFITLLYVFLPDATRATKLTTLQCWLSYHLTFHLPAHVKYGRFQYWRH